MAALPLNFPACPSISSNTLIHQFTPRHSKYIGILGIRLCSVKYWHGTRAYFQQKVRMMTLSSYSVVERGVQDADHREESEDDARPGRQTALPGLKQARCRSAAASSRRAESMGSTLLVRKHFLIAFGVGHGSRKRSEKLRLSDDCSVDRATTSWTMQQHCRLARFMEWHAANDIWRDKQSCES